MLTDHKIIDFFSDEMVLAKIDAEQDTILRKSYNVSAYPTMVMTDRDGEEIDRIVGYVDAEELIQTLRDYAQGIGTLDDLLRKADTTTDRLLFLKIADKHKYSGGQEEAKAWFQRVIAEGEPTDSLSGESRLSLADMYRRAKQYDRALEAFGQIARDFKEGMFIEDADIWSAIVYRQKGDTLKAIEAFEDFMKHYPESEDIEYATKQIRKLKGIAEESQ